MGILPSAAVDLASDLPPAELLARLRQVVGEGPDAPLAGRVGAGGFVVTRARDYRTTFLPVLRGSVAPDGGGARVRLRVRPHATVLVFLGIWGAFLAAAGALAVAWRLRDPENSALWLAGPLLLALLTWRLVSGVFAAEARWAVAQVLELVPGLRREELLSPRVHL